METDMFGNTIEVSTQVRDVSPAMLVKDLPAGALYWMRQDEAPQASIAAFIRRFKFVPEQVLVCGRWLYVGPVVEQGGRLP